MGQKKAIIAVARKILKLIFKLMSYNITYDNKVALSILKINFTLDLANQRLACFVCNKVFSNSWHSH